MELAHFHRVRTAVQSNARPGAAADLVAAQERLEQGLASTGWFCDIEVGATDDLDNLVVALAVFPQQLTEERVAQRLSLLWEDRVRYPFWAVHTILVGGGQAELEGATRSSTQGHYVTVHIVAQKSATAVLAPQEVVVVPAVTPAVGLPAQRGGSSWDPFHRAGRGRGRRAGGDPGTP